MNRFALVLLIGSLAIVFVGAILAAALQMLPHDESFVAPPVERDITIGRDQVVGKRQARLRELQASDVDVARRDQPRQVTRRDIEQRRASSYLSRGF